MRSFFVLFLSFLFLFAKTQDTVYARKIIKELASAKYFGRGYVKNGERSREIPEKELKKNKTLPLFADGYFQNYKFSVNTFPSEMELKLNGKVLVPGKDFIVAPESNAMDGIFILKKKG